MPTITVQLAASGNIGIEVPPEVVESFGAGKRVPVIVTINDYSYRSTIATMGGKFLIPLAKEHREPAGISHGETVTVTIEHDAAPRDYPVPDDLAAALEAARARAAFDTLAPSKRKEHIRQVESAKAEDTRLRRIEKIVSTLA